MGTAARDVGGWADCADDITGARLSAIPEVTVCSRNSRLVFCFKLHLVRRLSIKNGFESRWLLCFKSPLLSDGHLTRPILCIRSWTLSRPLCDLRIRTEWARHLDAF